MPTTLSLIGGNPWPFVHRMSWIAIIMKLLSTLMLRPWIR